MDREGNRQVAAELFARFSAGDVQGVLDLLTDDVIWRIPGKPDLTPAAGSYDKARIARLFERMLGRLEDGLAMTVRGVIAEGDKVAVEVTSRGKLTNGRVYEQEYHFLLEFRDGRVSAVREYLDTQHAHAVWFAPSIPLIASLLLSGLALVCPTARAASAAPLRPLDLLADGQAHLSRTVEIQIVEPGRGRQGENVGAAAPGGARYAILAV